MTLRSAANYDKDAASVAAGLSIDPEDDVTSQEFKEDADINVIVERFGVTGKFEVPATLPSSGDFTGVSDYHSALNQVIAAEEAFMLLPAKVRKRFDNDVGAMIAFLEDSENEQEAVELGLINPPPFVEPPAGPPSAPEG